MATAWYSQVAMVMSLLVSVYLAPTFPWGVDYLIIVLSKHEPGAGVGLLLGLTD
jgi:hypothetical protein